MQKADVLYDIARRIARVEQELRDKGISLEIDEDFLKFEALCHSVQERKDISAPFSSRYFDIVARDGFWIRGMDQGGRTISTQAMRLTELGETNLATFWQQQLKRLHGGALKNTSSPGAQKISGRVVYHGDVWIDRSCAKLHLGGLLSHLALFLALLKWHPDFIYGFMRERLCLSGFALKEGYFHCEPVGSHWVEEPEDIDPNDWLVWMGRQDLEYLAQLQTNSNALHSR